MVHGGRTFPRMQYLVHFVVLELCDCYTAINSISICKTGQILNQEHKGKQFFKSEFLLNRAFNKCHVFLSPLWIRSTVIAVWRFSSVRTWLESSGRCAVTTPPCRLWDGATTRSAPSKSWVARKYDCPNGFNHLIITVKHFLSKNGGWFSGFFFLLSMLVLICILKSMQHCIHHCIRQHLRNQTLHLASMVTCRLSVPISLAGMLPVSWFPWLPVHYGVRLPRRRVQALQGVRLPRSDPSDPVYP